MTTPTPSHSPLPWRRNVNAKYPIYSGEAPNHHFVAVALGETKEQANANLTLIVHAVNSLAAHEACVEALKNLLTSLMYEDPNENGAVDEARAALKRLEEGK